MEPRRSIRLREIIRENLLTALDKSQVPRKEVGGTKKGGKNTFSQATIATGTGREVATTRRRKESLLSHKKK